ncbi:MAG: hypothetical protein AB1776_01320 [Bacillota bacterium]
MTGRAALCVINDVPVIGSRFACREEALASVRRMVALVEKFVEPAAAACGVEFLRKEDGPATLRVTVGEEVLACVNGLDDVTLWRFKKLFKKKDVYPVRLH